MASARSAVGALCLLPFLAALVGCGLSLEGGADLERTFDRAMVATPATRAGDVRIGTPSDLDGLAATRRYAVVLYLHGCTGIGNYTFMRALAGAGYVVVAPDSMARRFRPLQCDPRTNTGGHNLFVYDFRTAEITYALQRLSAYPWVDWANLFLVGTSEGGVAAALYRGDEFRARVITQWTCVGAPLVAGIEAPPETPILAIVRGQDPWYDPARTKGQRGDCGLFMAGRPGSRSIVLEGGASHDVFKSSDVVREILRFLQANRAG
jgi:dienelactone hydrolase